MERERHRDYSHEYAEFHLLLVTFVALVVGQCVARHGQCETESRSESRQDCLQRSGIRHTETLSRDVGILALKFERQLNGSGVGCD